VHILASRIGETLYVGVTNDLIRRIAEHKSKEAESFTKDYDVVRLVYFECFDDVENAIRREKRLKKIKEMEPCLEDRVDRKRKSKLE
jgi:putative endonuclease